MDNNDVSILKIKVLRESRDMVVVCKDVPLSMPTNFLSIMRKMVKLHFLLHARYVPNVAKMSI